MYYNIIEIRKEVDAALVDYKKKAQALLKTAYALGSCFLAGAAISLLFLVNARVNGGSMLPGLEDGDMCIGPKGSQFVTYGSIVILDDRDYGRILIKRVIGMPGDEIEIFEDGHAARNGDMLNEPYILEQAAGKAGTYSVPDGCLFVLGDNRGSSADSRSTAIGFVSESRIIGRVVFRFWPLDRIGLLR